MIAKTPTRTEAGLPEDAFVFACFNGMQKTTAPVFSRWMDILLATPNSVLWLLGGPDVVNQRLRKLAEERGVAPERLIFAPKAANPHHLARIALADLFLDTFAVNAHTTASDALWAGLPVVAKPGRSFVARVSAGLVRAAGLPELVVKTVADYEALALALARDPHRLAELKARLRTSPAELPLFDTARYARKLETAYREMIAIHEAGEPPRHIRISP